MHFPHINRNAKTVTVPTQLGNITKKENYGVMDSVKTNKRTKKPIHY